LTPLLPSATIDKVLEEANMAYESESQKECQDILDSTDDMLELELPKEKPSLSFGHNYPIVTSSNRKLPQVDGSNDDEFSGQCDGLAGTSSLAEINSEFKSASEYHVLHSTGASTVSKDIRNKKCGSLPLSTIDQVNNDGEQATLPVTHPVESDIGDYARSDHLNINEVRNSAFIIRNKDKNTSDSKEVHTSVNCSLRDLMRRKRSYRVEQAEYEPGTTKKLLLDRHEELNACFWQKQLDLKTMQTDEEEMENQKICEDEVSNHANLFHGKLLLSTGTDAPLQAGRPKDECFGEHEMEGIEASTELRNCTEGGSALMNDEPGPHKPEKLCLFDSIEQSVASMGENLKVGSTFTNHVASDACIQSPFLDTRLRTAAVHEVKAPERSPQTDSSASTSVKSSFIIDSVSGKYNFVGQSSPQSLSFVQHDQRTFCENSVKKSDANDVQVLFSEKVDNQNVGENLLHEIIGSEPTDLKGNHMKITEMTTSKNPPADKNLESTTSNTHLHLVEDSPDEMPGFNFILFDPIFPFFSFVSIVSIFAVYIELVLGLCFSKRNLG